MSFDPTGQRKKGRDQKEYDRNRDLIIRELGISILRIKNDELHDVTAVKEKIIAHLD